MLVKYAIPVAILTFVVIIGQSFSATIGTLLSGQPLKQSIQTGMSLSQIGEFSFIIATLGMTLKVTSDFLYLFVVSFSHYDVYHAIYDKNVHAFFKFSRKKTTKKMGETNRTLQFQH